MKISLVVLTFNRAETVARAVAHNIANAGRKIDELVWVDNGSTDGVRDVMRGFNPDVSILHAENLGVAKGYNRGFAVSGGDWIVLTGCDMLMPDGWLATMERYAESLPSTDIVAMYSVPFEQCRERLYGEMLTSPDGLPYQRALPMGRRMMRRDVLSRAGYLREDFGLYGWEDVEWARRCVARGLFCYAVPGMVAEHLGTEGVRMFKPGGDPQGYHEFKKAEVSDPAKLQLMARCEDQGYPYYNPYA